jgi:TM2 domain-containing membrane protein YozV
MPERERSASAKARQEREISMPRPDFDDELFLVRRPAPRPSPGIAAVLSVLIPGLGQVYAGRLGAGALWFLGTGFAYWAILIPGFLVHAVCVWSAYESARAFREY